RFDGIDFIEWRFDPCLAAGGALAIHRLGATSTRYFVDPEEPGPDGRSLDRLLAEWWIETPHVKRRLSARRGLIARSADVTTAPVVIRVAPDSWPTYDGDAVDGVEPRVWIPIPADFDEIQRKAPELALRWRMV